MVIIQKNYCRYLCTAMSRQQKIELMAPAGSYEALMAAIHAGCDSVYFGVEQFNMRARATMNFTLEDLEKVGNICREHHVRSYLTLNTIVYDHDLSAIKTVLDKARAAGISAELYPEASKIKKQFDYANKKQIPFVVVIGSDEMQSGELTFKDMNSGTQEKLKIQAILDKISTHS